MQLNHWIINLLIKLTKGKISLDEPMLRHTSFRIGGPADVFVVPKNITDLQNILAFSAEYDIPLNVIGNGTNILVSDFGVSGLVVHMLHFNNAIEIDSQKVTVGAGYLLPSLCGEMMKKGLSGLEFAAGIPGTVGGAIVMNAGTRHGEICNILTQATVMDKNGKMFILRREDLEFGYRKSMLQTGGFIVLSGEFILSRANASEIEQRMSEYLANRKLTQPLNFPNAGSVFKNPPNISAGKLIEDCGGKGMSEGDAKVSQLHANFIINAGSARAQDVADLISKIQTLVYQRFNIQLALEIKLMGEGLTIS